MTAAEIAVHAGGRVVAGDVDALATSFTHDTRVLAPGACFVALRGHRDGHDFVATAFGAGAAVALVAEGTSLEAPGSGKALVAVDDPQRALTALAAATRDVLDHLEVVGITGSTGKTSTKDLLAAALARSRSVRASAESFNNEIGLPLTVLGAETTTDVLVVEMGARFPGNVAELCAIARPTCGVVTNVGLAHAEHLGGLEGVAAVKGELVASLPPTGLAVLNDDDPATPGLARRTSARVLRVGRSSRADVRIVAVHLDDELRPAIELATPWGAVDARLAVRGEHQVANAALACAVALASGVPPADVAAGIADAVGSRWRLQLERSPGGVIVLNDAYNANPDSTAAALRALARFPGARARVAVLGEMRELGEHADEAHASIGALVDHLGIDHLVGVGAGGAAIAAATSVAREVVDDARGALHALGAVVSPGDVVLVKASRAVGLEDVAAGLVAGAVDPSVPAGDGPTGVGG